MSWWEKKKSILVREKKRVDSQYPNNNFVFEIRDDSLWITGTLFDFFQFDCKYPESYPFYPPAIYPKDRKTNWVSKHQYIKEGRFCLDIREKTWNSTLSAADIIKSLENLLIAENIRLIKKDDKLTLYEEDEPTNLQKQFKKLRCIIPSDIAFPSDKSFGILKYIFRLSKGTYRLIVTAIMENDERIESSLAKGIWKSDYFIDEYGGLWVRTSFENIVELLKITELSKLKSGLVEKGVMSQDQLEDIMEKKSLNMLLLFDSRYPEYYYYIDISMTKNICEPLGTYLFDLRKSLSIIPSKDNHEILGKAKATIIGCGSGGSKIAEYLVKAGVNNLVLIDGDTLTTENVLRHFCQLDDISVEKVYAVWNKLLKINPDIQVTSINRNLYAIDDFINESIKDSTIIIVATASYEEIFNEYSYSLGIPALYSKVYPMGFGGEVLRIIPNVTPCFECSHYLKEVLIEKQFEERIFPDTDTISYGQSLDGQYISLPALAVDADFISLITAKLAIEILLESDYSRFKNVPNIFLWGNSKKWIFEENFQCLKIKSDTIQPLKNCLICYGENVIEDELGMSKDDIEKEYIDIISKSSCNK